MGKYNMMYFPHTMVGPESGFRTNKPIRTLADFKGVMLRTGVLQTIWVLEQLGAKPMRIPGGEIYMALKMGTIDGAEFSVPSTDWGIKFQETTKYWVTPAGWHQVGTHGRPAHQHGCLEEIAHGPTRPSWRMPPWRT